MDLFGRSVGRRSRLYALAVLVLPLVLAACNNGNSGPGY